MFCNLAWALALGSSNSLLKNVSFCTYRLIEKSEVSKCSLLHLSSTGILLTSQVREHRGKKEMVSSESSVANKGAKFDPKALKSVENRYSIGRRVGSIDVLV